MHLRIGKRYIRSRREVMSVDDNGHFCAHRRLIGLHLLDLWCSVRQDFRSGLRQEARSGVRHAHSRNCH